MDLEEIGINAGNRVDSAQDSNYWRALVNAAPPDSISHGVSYLGVNGRTILEWILKK